MHLHHYRARDATVSASLQDATLHRFLPWADSEATCSELKHWAHRIRIFHAAAAAAQCEQRASTADTVVMHAQQHRVRELQPHLHPVFERRFHWNPRHAPQFKNFRVHRCGRVRGSRGSLQRSDCFLDLHGGGRE